MALVVELLRGLEIVVDIVFSKNYIKILSILSYFDLLFDKHRFPLILWLSEMRVLDSNGPYISTRQTKPRNVCLLVISAFCLSPFCLLSSVVHLQPTPVYVDAWNIYQKYHILSKIILMWLDFWFSKLFVWAGQKHCPMFTKISQKWTAFLFDNT